jgi:hypothetical protein
MIPGFPGTKVPSVVAVTTQPVLMAAPASNIAMSEVSPVVWG